MMKKKFMLPALLCMAMSTLFIACEKDENVVPAPTVVKDWNIPLSTQHENTPPAGRTETGVATLQLLSDNSLNYTIAVSGLSAADGLTAAHIHVGNVITNGAVILGLNPTFNGANASGNIKNLRSTFIDSLNNNINELYFNVHSTQVPGGLVRGQLNTGIEFAAFVSLAGTNEVPAITTTATGTALIRITTDKKLYSNVAVSNLEAGDALTAAHIHKAAAGVNGGVILGLCSGAADFGVVKIFPLADALFTSIKADAIYVNAHSVKYPSGVVRGQIR